MRPFRLLILLVTFAVVQGYSAELSAGPSLTTIFSFNAADGRYPYTSLTVGKQGVLYGTTCEGKSCHHARGGCGLVFELRPPEPGGTGWKQTVLYHFSGTPDGDHPYGSLAVGSNGELYGTTAYGGWGSRNCGGIRRGCGVVFELQPPADPHKDWTETIIHTFKSPDGAYPYAGLIVDASGNLYGTTTRGGTANQGTVFELSPPVAPGSAWTMTNLYDFAGGNDASDPLASLVFEAGGALYGVGAEGGLSGDGAVFQLTPPSSPGGAWTEAVLYSFMNGSDGRQPYGTLVFDRNDNLYGTTYVGGPSNDGIVFEISPPAFAGGSWSETVLYAFMGNQNNDGSHPQDGLVIDADGVLYGTTGEGGDAANRGTVFSLSPPAVSGGPWTETLLHEFGKYPDGKIPVGGLVFGRRGMLYGTTAQGGAAGDGSIFELKP